MKTKSPALTLGWIEHDTRLLVTDADYCACGYDVYRIRNKEDAGRVHDAINARNPARAEWRAKYFEAEQDPVFSDLLDIDQMFDVDDSEGTDVEDVADDILNAPLDIPPPSNIPDPSTDFPSHNSPPSANNPLFGQPHLTHSDSGGFVGRSDGEGPEREWSRIRSAGIWGHFVPSSPSTVGDVAQHMTVRGIERMRASFQSGAWAVDRRSGC